MDHWRAANKVLRYLQQIKDFMVVTVRTEACWCMQIDFVDSPNDMKSISGYLYIPLERFRGRVQTIVVSSTLQTKFIACYEATI